jgi:hypothetical protein
MRTITDYMMNLHKELMEKRQIADNTASQYIRSLYSLNSDRPFTNLSWLKNVASVDARLSEYAESTQKTLLSTIVSTLSLVKDKPTYKKIYSHWYSEMMERTNADKGKDTSQKTDKQEKNWLSWDVVKGHEERLQKEVEELVKNKELTAGQWDTVLSYMVLSLYTQFAPRRNQDYQFMKVVTDSKQATKDDTNYIVLNSGEFIFNKYKTAKSHGAQTFPIPAPLMSIIKTYLSAHPLAKKKSKVGIQFLVSFKGEPLLAVNAITRILNRIFGKNVGSSMLRHIYLSSKYDVTEMDADADKMGHTSGVQHSYMKGKGEGEVAEGSQNVDIPMLNG